MDRLDWTKIDWLQLSDVLYWSVGRQCTNIVTPQLALKREVRFCIILLNEWKYNMKMPNKTIELNNTRQEKTDKIVGRGWKYKKKQWQKQLESYRRIQTFTKEPSHACRRSWQTSVRIIVSFGHRCNTTPDPIFSQQNWDYPQIQTNVLYAKVHKQATPPRRPRSDMPTAIFGPFRWLSRLIVGSLRLYSHDQ